MVDPEAQVVVRQLALVHGVSGLFNIFLFSWVAYIGLALLCGIPTFGLGAVCGLLGFLLVPIGMVEILFAGILWADPRQFLRFSRYLAVLEAMTLLMGNPIGTVCGLLALALGARDEVRGLLDG